MTQFAGRYIVQRALGTGGHSDVFLVEDLDTRRSLALKRLRATSETRSYMLRQEFNMLAELAHPHIVRVYEFGKSDDQAFYTMELVNGQDFVTVARALGWQEVAALVAQALSALAHVHGSDVLHLDIKPENLLVEQRHGAAHVVLTDFGLAQRMRQHGQGFGRGTLAYIAPEMMHGQSYDLRVDLYALGRVVFEAFAPEQVEANVAAPLPLLESLRPDLPVALCRWVDRLATADLSLRFARAQAALQELASIVSLPEDLGPETERTGLLIPRLVGRNNELTQAKRILRDALQLRRFHVLVVTGAAGHGKTRFLRALMAISQHDNMRAEWLSQQAANERLKPASDKREDIEAHAQALTATLDGGHVWFIDDGGKLSDLSVLVLDRLIERAAGLSAAVVLTTHMASATSSWQQLEMLHSARMSLVNLGPLHRRDLHALAFSVLGNGLPDGWIAELHAATAGSPLWAQELLHEWVDAGQLRFDGNNFVTTQPDPPVTDRTRLSELIQQRMANIDEQLWPAVFAAAILGREVTPERVTRLVTPYLGRTDNPAEKLVAMALGAMTQHHMLEQRDEGYRFIHEEILRELRKMIPESTRRRLHSQAAALFRNKDELDTRDFHLVRGVDPLIAADAALTAGDRARAGFAHRRAIRRYRRGYNRLLDPALPRDAAHDARAAVFALRIADSATQIDEQALGLEWYATAKRLAPDDMAVHAQADVGQAELLRHRCEYREALVHAERALRNVPEGTGSFGSALRLVARLEQHLGNDEKARAHFEQALLSKERLGDRGGMTRVELDLANLFQKRGEMSEAEVHARQAEAIAEALQDDGLRARAYRQIGHLLCLKGDSLLALDHLTEAQQLAKQVGDRRTEGAALRDIATLRRQQGRIGEARALLEKSSRLFFVTGAKDLYGDCLHQLAAIEQRSGHYGQALKLSEELLAIRRDLKDVVGRAHAHIAFARLHLDIGLYREALHYGELTLREARKTDDRLLLLLAEEVIVSTQLETGERSMQTLRALARRASELQIARVEVSILCRLIASDPNEDTLLRLQALGTHADNHEARAHAAWGSALLKVQQKLHAFATPDFMTALTLAESAGQDELGARIKSDLGATLLTLGKPREAMSVLAQAMMTLRQTYSALGAKKNAGYLAVAWRRQLRDRFRQANEPAPLSPPLSQ